MKTGGDPRGLVFYQLCALSLPGGSSRVASREIFLFVFVLGRFLDLYLPLSWMESVFQNAKLLHRTEILALLSSVSCLPGAAGNGLEAPARCAVLASSHGRYAS